MKVKRFVADNMQLALKMVSAELGPDAVIVSSRRLDNGMEVVASSEMLGEIDSAKQSELDRQLRLQRELEAAKQAARASAAQRQEYAADTATRYAPQQRDSQQASAQVSRTEADVAAATRLAEQAVEARKQSEETYQTRLQEMQGELRELKDWLVSHQGSAWDTRRPLTWQQSQLWQRCQDIGLEPAWADRVVSMSDQSGDLEQAWKSALGVIQSDLPLLPQGVLEKGGTIALVGPTGAGKTTTLGKIAARFVQRHGPDSVAFVTLDNYRMAAHDQLQAFARILGVEMKVVLQNGDLVKTLSTLRKKKLVLIDSAGLASQDPHFSSQLSMLKQTGRDVRKFLVLPLTSQARCLQENYEHFKPAGLDGCIFTKLDECFSLGAGLSVAALTRLPLTLITDGPHIPDDLHYPDASRLVNLAEQMARMARTRWQAAEAMNMATQQKSFQHGV
ncbi:MULTISPECIES: flagellar biosynthesis protein FlhF [Thalassolituus]|uniref:flagellar biosynthesis protein FlhF n=1 Tax=Thalassolituus TaxID=187492 RepID=UPI000C566EB0|nr:MULTISPECIES: flagellar biosynthesis protein FlhF [Thalassolituus]MAX87816.1 flagellar biosynthesis protein FlhF [Oceanospirillaceae bacterium]HCG79396.1 flagellar biosynthesis protein FlhF [Oceanospirillales bacterium]|tara:strand:- start:25838 stop:27181 length:1344 start_codon:yes stop_codon:yes gene_type:complete